MIKLRKLKVHGFRGILNEAELDFTDKCKGLVLIGDNGTGKSSFVDAVEWLFTGRIEHLAREGCGDAAYRHRHLAEDVCARVELTTDAAGCAGARLLDQKLRSSYDPLSGPFVQFVDKARADTVMLRYGQMRDFVDKTKTEKLRYLSEILGLGALSRLRDELLAALNKLEKDADFRYLGTQINDYQKGLSAAVGIKKYDQAKAIQFADDLRKIVGGEIMIVDLASLRLSTDELLALSQRDQRARVILALRQTMNGLRAGQTHAAVLDPLERLSRAVINLAADKASVDQIALGDLYRAGQTVLERDLGDVNACPLCGSIVSREELAEHLCAQLNAIKEISARVSALRSERQQVRIALQAAQNWLDTSVSASSSLGLDEAKPFIEAVVPFLSFISKRLTALVADADPLQPIPPPSNEEQQLAAGVADTLEALLTAAQAKIGELEGSLAEKEYYDRLEQLDRIARDLLALETARGRKAIYDRQIGALRKVHAQCERLERKALSDVLDVVSSDVNRYYCMLHQNEGFDQIRLSPTKDRGLEFEFKFHGEVVTPPARLLSESHLNTLGACLFLASARHFNRHTRFLILDDIINSVDAGHRTPLARLLRDEFADFQLILLTHDRMWFDILRRTAPQWLTLEITEWTYGEGLRFKHKPGDLEAEARSQLIQGEVEAAGNRARKWFERVLKERCLDLEVTVPFRFNDRNEERMPGELLPALRNHIKKTQLFAATQSLFNDLEASQFIASRLSHDNQYSSAPPKRADVETFLSDVRRLDGLFLCADCASYIAAEHTPKSAKCQRCKCGKLELR